MPTMNLPSTLGWLRNALNENKFPKNNFTATTDPTTGNNSGAGYEVGSRWINTTSNRKWTLTSISGTTATWTLDLDVASGGTAPVFGTGLSGAGTQGDPVRVTRPVPAGTDGQVVGYGPGGALTPVTVSGGGTIPADVPRTQSNPDAVFNPAAPWVNSVMMRYGNIDLPMPVGFNERLSLRAFGAITLQEFRVGTGFPAELTSAQLVANTNALIRAEQWAFENGGYIQLSGGMLDIQGEVVYRAGCGFGGIGEHHTVVRQRLIPRSAADVTAGLTYANVFVEHPTLKAGFNTFENFSIHGGWESLKEYEGSTGGVWEFDLATSFQKGLSVGTRGSSETAIGNGPGPSKLYPNGGSDSQNRVRNMRIFRCKGYGLYATGRGEMMVNTLWTERCARNGMFTAMADSWYDNITCSTSGDSAIVMRGGASNARVNNIKPWYSGCYKSSEVVGAGLEMPDSGIQNVQIHNITPQDNWGPGMLLQGNQGIRITGAADEAGGGRLPGSNPSLGYSGTRSLPRVFMRMPGPFRHSEIDLMFSNGGRNGLANYPYLLELSGVDIDFSEIKFRGLLTSNSLTMDMSSGSITIGANTWQKSLGVLTTNAFVNAKNYLQVLLGDRLIYGQFTLAQLSDSAHSVNDPLYGPSRVLTDLGQDATRLSAELGGGWDVRATPVTQAQWDGWSEAFRARGNFVITA